MSRAPRPPHAPGKKEKGKEKRKILFISHHYIKCISLPCPRRGDPASPPSPPTSPLQPSPLPIAPRARGGRGMEPPNPPGPRAWGAGRRGGGAASVTGFASPKPSQDGGGLGEAPNHHARSCPHGGVGGSHQEAPRASGHEAGGAAESGGEIKWGLTPSEPRRYLGNTGKRPKNENHSFFLLGGGHTVWGGGERRCVQAGGPAPRTSRAGGGTRQARHPTRRRLGHV